MPGDLIFVTGGTGFLGRHLVTYLLQQGFRVRLFVRPTSDVSWIHHDRIQIVSGDITDAETVLQGCQGCKYIVHAAGLFRLWGSEKDFQAINLLGTKNVCEAALKNNIERLVYISTVAVVGQPVKGIIIDEDTISHPLDDYQKSKFAAEKSILGLWENHDLPAIILRPGAFYGPGGRYGFNRLFIEEPMRGWRIKVDNGRHFTFPVFVPDIPPAITKALKLGKPGEVYIISDRSIMQAELNQIISAMLAISTWRLNVPRSLMVAFASLMEFIAKFTHKEPFYSLNLQHYVFNDWQVSSKKARQELGFNPTSIEEGLKKTIAWYKLGEWK